MRSALLALALLVATPVAAAAADECITFDNLGLPANAEKIVLTATEMATARALAEKSGHGVSAEVVEMIAIPGPLTHTVLIVGMTADHCVDGAAVAGAGEWATIHGSES